MGWRRRRRSPHSQVPALDRAAPTLVHLCLPCLYPPTCSLTLIHASPRSYSPCSYSPPLFVLTSPCSCLPTTPPPSFTFEAVAAAAIFRPSSPALIRVCSCSCCWCCCCSYRCCHYLPTFVCIHGCSCHCCCAAAGARCLYLHQIHVSTNT